MSGANTSNIAEIAVNYFKFLGVSHLEGLL